MKDLLSKIEEIAKIGSYETDMATGIWTGSDNFIKIFGLPKKEAYSVKEFQELIHSEDYADVMAYFAKCIEIKEDFNYEYRCLNANGDVIYVSSHSKIYYDEATGVPLKVIGTKQDVTESKIYEKKLIELNELNHKKNEVLSMVAHDLRAPIAQLEGLTRILKQNIDDRHLKLIKMQEDACESAKNIITELIEIAELEDKSYDLRTVKTDINKLVEQSIERFRFKALDKNIEIKVSQESVSEVNINPERFSRVIDNLLSNALKFTPKDKSIEVSLQNLDSKLVFKIRDEGIGIKKEHIPLLFDKFSKTIRRRGTQGEHSTGLGLSIVKQIVELHNGTIEVESEVNKGTVFTIEL